MKCWCLFIFVFLILTEGPGSPGSPGGPVNPWGPCRGDTHKTPSVLYLHHQYWTNTLTALSISCKVTLLSNDCNHIPMHMWSSSTQSGSWVIFFSRLMSAHPGGECGRILKSVVMRIIEHKLSFHMTGLSFSDCDVIQLCIFGVSPGWLQPLRILLVTVVKLEDIPVA